MENKLEWKPICAAFIALGVVTLMGVILFFRPIEQADTLNGPLVHPAVGMIIYLVLSVGLFDWVAKQVRSAYKAAFIIAASQFILVNVDFVFRGERGLLTAGASTILMILTWVAVAYVYSFFSKNKTPVDAG